MSFWAALTISWRLRASTRQVKAHEDQVPTRIQRPFSASAADVEYRHLYSFKYGGPGTLAYSQKGNNRRKNSKLSNSFPFATAQEG